ncbi:hypothetical protein CGCS363_v001398 [Colletotrichum siamense]|uniref:uncharacterized protein n=1 Tax=Colletotrichum siamense TaxID=690259 RepID=UPI0018730766|nr:uncharacterized protein CGCS363_v001398 [Colletotrichum siamense]KAF5516473.1 hypothetical protein CGCS363_v001398 [Colletotrichum siamense]
MSLPLGPPRPDNDRRPGLSCPAPESAQLRLAYTHHPHNHRLEPITTSFQDLFAAQTTRNATRISLARRLRLAVRRRNVDITREMNTGVTMLSAEINTEVLIEENINIW